MRRFAGRTVNKVVAIAAVLVLAALGAIGVAAPAQAASLGTGWDHDASSHLGAYLVGGVYAYCMDPGVPPPLSASSDGGLITGYTSHGPAAGQNSTYLDATTLGRINYLVSTWGQTTNKDQAAAVAMAVATTANPAAYAAHTAPWGDQYYSTYMPAGNWANVKSLAASYRAAAAAYTPSSGSGTASMSFTVDNNNYTGHLNITAMSPSSATGTITLTNGHFSNGTASLSGTFSAGQSISVVGVPPDGVTDYEISATASFTAPGGPAADVHLWVTSGRQGLASPGSAGPVNFSASAHDPFDRTTTFAPVTTTVATTGFIKKGDFPQDDVTFATTNFTSPISGEPVSNPWPQTSGGSYFPIIAKGTWYGPSSAPFVQSASIPAATPVAGRATITTSTSAGPTTTYTATSDTAALEAGYYTWVWSIDAADQTPFVQTLLLDNYAFVDDFGQAAEGTVSPAQISFATQLTDSVATRCNTITDTITPTLTGGAWLLTPAGVRVPVTMTGDIYWEQNRPLQAATAPSAAVRIGTVSTILGSPAAVTSPPFSVGCDTGFMTVQWSIRKADQPAQYQGLVSDWSDGYGIPAETVQILGPTITTKALPTGPGGIVQDVATVTGPIPSAGMDVVWNGYLRPTGSAVAVCTPATLAYTSATPTLVMTPGKYTSEEFDTPAGFLGSIDWIETVSLHGAPDVLHVGDCGAAGETSVSALPTVSTTPPTGAQAGAAAVDTLTVDGWVPPSTTAVVRLYKQAKGAKSLVCDSSTQVGGLLGPSSIAPGVADAATYKSPASAKLKVGNYGFVAQLVDQSGTVMAEGGCQDELFSVRTLAFTGVTSSPERILGWAVLLLLAGVAVMLVVRRPKRSPWSFPITE